VLVNSTQFFENISPEIWNYTIGGYKVLDKWLKDRKDKKLTFEEIQTFECICEAIRLSLKTTNKIDNEIEAAGGWPFAVIEGSKRKAA
jgi:hypothetical protein